MIGMFQSSLWNDRIQTIIGGGARYFSEPIIGFTATGTSAANIVRSTFVSKQIFFDTNVAYRRKLPSIFCRVVT